MQTKYSFKTIENKWQQQWNDIKAFQTKSSTSKPKFYILEMFPYPSGNIHMGHVRNYTIGDVIARYKRAKGYNVLHPMGWDSFGLPAENAAIAHNIHPAIWTYKNIKEMRLQFQQIGLAIDWSKEIITCSPDYYQHEQAMFIKFYQQGLAYRKESWVNWDPQEQTVLANEQIINGKGWRSGVAVQQKQLNQWFLKITDFAESLLQNLKDLSDWPESVKNMQTKWIGKSLGVNIDFKISNSTDIIKVYTTRPETIFGATYLALSIQHPEALKLQQFNPAIQAFIEKHQALGTIEENISKEEKVGIDTGLVAINPFTKQKIPIYIANYVLNYGTGAVMACPAHDARDFEFAKKYNLAIITVIKPNHTDDSFQVSHKAFEDNGIMINSSLINHLSTKEAKIKIIKAIESNKYGQATTNFRLRDWGVSRQRFWGCPIPIVYCDKCGTVPLALADLPLRLPEDTTMLSLENHPTWKYTQCPKCAQEALRETDTLDTFFESSWYFLRYATIGSNQALDSDAINYWLPVDYYVGGIEHAVMHLLYARFFTKALIKTKMLNATFNEPFKALMTQGMICHKTYQDEDGNWLYPDAVIEQDDGTYCTQNHKKVTVGRSEKMSKSKKNTVSPDYICKIYGADTARMFVLSDSPPNKDLEWTDQGIEGIHKFIHKLWNFSIQLLAEGTELNLQALSSAELKLYAEIQQYLFKIETNIQASHLNKALALNRELFNLLESHKSINLALMQYGLNALLQTLNPFIPHVTEELWQISHSQPLAHSSWLKLDANFLATSQITLPVQFNGKIKGKLQIDSNLSQAEILELIKADMGLKKYLQNIPIRKIIYVPQKIINIIV